MSTISHKLKHRNPEPHSEAERILQQGIHHMRDRASRYDKPQGERSMAATVKAFEAVTGDGMMSSEERGWLFMELLKAVRSEQGDYKPDNYEDGAAYAGLKGEAALKERGTATCLRTDLDANQ